MFAFAEVEAALTSTNAFAHTLECCSGPVCGCGQSARGGMYSPQAGMALRCAVCCHLLSACLWHNKIISANSSLLQQLLNISSCLIVCIPRDTCISSIRLEEVTNENHSSCKSFVSCCISWRTWVPNTSTCQEADYIKYLNVLNDNW